MVCRNFRPNANAPGDLLHCWWQLTPAKYEYNFVDLSGDTPRRADCIRQKACTSAVCSYRTMFAAQWNANCRFVRVDLQMLAAQIECTPISGELIGWQDEHYCTNYAWPPNTLAWVFCIIAFLYRRLLIIRKSHLAFSATATEQVFSIPFTRNTNGNFRNERAATRSKTSTKKCRGKNEWHRVRVDWASQSASI